MTRGKVTLRISDDLITALDQLVEAGRFETRSEALRAGIGLLLQQQATLIPDTARGGESKHLPDEEGGTQCGCDDDAIVMEVAAEEVADLDLCGGCDPAVERNQEMKSHPSPPHPTPDPHEEVRSGE